MSLALAVLGASLLGSVHCAAMCGPFVCFYTTPGANAPAGPGHLGYNFGRLISYLLLGTIAGTLGHAIDTAGAAHGTGMLAGLVAGVLMVLWGIASLARQRGLRVARLPVPAAPRRFLARLLEVVRGQSPAVRGLVTGAVTTLLPCGWLYAFVVTAGGTGSAWRAATIMFVFWLGTLPMMLAVGLGARRLFGPLQRHLPALSAGIMVMLGLFAVGNHLGLVPGMDWMHRLTETAPGAHTAHGAAMTHPH